MKTIKIIDLLYKIHTGEKSIKKIKYKDKIFNYERYVVGEGDSYFDAEWAEVEGYRAEVNGSFYYLRADTSNLEDEVEIIEEDNKIKKIDNWFSLKGTTNNEEAKELISIMCNELKDKVNEIIDVINEMKENK